MSLASAAGWSPERSSVEPRHGNLGGWGLVEWMALSQTLLPALLLIPGAQEARVPIRIAAYGVSLAALVLYWGRRRGAHPSEPVLCLVLCLLAIMIVHPTTNTPLAGIAQTMLYLSVMAPVFWAPALVRGRDHLRRVLWILLVANGLNSFVGVMQVYDPDRWMPPEFSDVVLGGAHGLDRVSYTGPDGVLIIRPPGLTDNPGAVAGPGAIAAVLGFVLLMRSRTLLAYLTTAAFGILGVAAILLTHVRTSLLVALGSMCVYLTLLVVRREYAKAFGAVLLISVGVAAAFGLGIVLGGQSISERYETLVEDDPLRVYYEARGLQMEHAIVELSREYPLGAGLARWGMMRRYFGDATNLKSPMIWSEIQVSSWLLDGGIALIILYGLALAIAAAWELTHTVESRVPAAREWGPVVVALNAGTLALVLSYTPFTSSIGMQYWFLVGCFYGACRSEENGILS